MNISSERELFSSYKFAGRESDSQIKLKGGMKMVDMKFKPKPSELAVVKITADDVRGRSIPSVRQQQVLVVPNSYHHQTRHAFYKFLVSEVEKHYENKQK